MASCPGNSETIRNVRQVLSPLFRGTNLTSMAPAPHIWGWGYGVMIPAAGMCYVVCTYIKYVNYCIFYVAYKYMYLTRKLVWSIYIHDMTWHDITLHYINTVCIYIEILELGRQQETFARSAVWGQGRVGLPWSRSVQLRSLWRLPLQRKGATIVATKGKS